MDMQDLIDQLRKTYFHIQTHVKEAPPVSKEIWQKQLRAIEAAIAHYERVLHEYQKLHPGVRITVCWKE